MKRLILLIFICYGKINAQESSSVGKEYKNFLSISIGVIRHEVKTISKSNRIEGLPSFDGILQIRFEHLLYRSVALEFGGLLSSLSTRYIVNRNFPDDGYSGYLGIEPKQGYFKFFTTYKYYIKLSQHTSLSFFAGPAVNITRSIGDNGSGGNSSITTTNNGPTLYFSNSYNIFKTNRFTFNALVGVEFQKKSIRHHKKRLSNTSFALRVAYTKGFVNFNTVEVKSYKSGSLNDEATLHHNGSGFLATIGFMFPFANGEKTTYEKIKTIPED